MQRVLSCDHVLFDECIETFRPLKEERADSAQKSHSYILIDFELTTTWHLLDCTVHPSTEVVLHGPNSAFICKVDNPNWSKSRPNLFGLALSTIITFITGRLCKSTRDDRLCNRNELTASAANELSLAHPVCVAGTGAIRHRSLSTETLKLYEDEISAFISKLRKLPYDTYVSLMQAIRLVHLSQMNKKDDFGLGYLLVVSAIEAIAQHAIKRKQVATKHKHEKTWTEKATQDKDFSELLAEYKSARGKNSYLRERYVKFIQKYAPHSDWETFTPNPDQERIDFFSVYIDSLEEDSPRRLFRLEKNPSDFYPTDLTEEAIGAIISDSYKHRSSFVHTGAQPPHRTPVNSFRFFQTHRTHGGEGTIEQLLPNYELLIGIARHSILNWMDTLKPHQHS